MFIDITAEQTGKPAVAYAGGDHYAVILVQVNSQRIFYIEELAVPSMRLHLVSQILRDFPRMAVGGGVENKIRSHARDSIQPAESYHVLFRQFHPEGICRITSPKKHIRFFGLAGLNTLPVRRPFPLV